MLIRRTVGRTSQTEGSACGDRGCDAPGSPGRGEVQEAVLGMVQAGRVGATSHKLLRLDSVGNGKACPQRGGTDFC